MVAPESCRSGQTACWRESVAKFFGSSERCFDGFERRMTVRLFIYFMSLGVTNAVIIVGMVKLLRVF